MEPYDNSRFSCEVKHRDVEVSTSRQDEAQEFCLLWLGA